MPSRLLFQTLGLLCAMAIFGCAGRPAASPSYSPPDAAPVRAALSAAQASVTSARDHATRAKAAVAQAKAAPDAPSLRLALEAADMQIDALSAQLARASQNLEDSHARIVELQTQVVAQTYQLNQTAVEKNKALTLYDKAEAGRRHVVAQRNKLVGLITIVSIGAVLIIFRRPLGAMAGIPIP